MTRMRRGHLGRSVSALVDGQLDADATERAWGHVVGCSGCRRRVVQEGRVKADLANLTADSPPVDLMGRLYSLDDTAPRTERDDVRQAWAVVAEIERSGASRRRAGLAAVGVGSVSLAVLGFAYLSGATLGIGQSPASTPTTSLSRPGVAPTPTTAVVAPVVEVQGWLPAPTRRNR